MPHSYLRRTRNAGIASALVALLTLGILTPAHAAVTVDDARPDHVVLTPTQHPEASQSFTWRTGAEVTEGWVKIRKAGSEDPWRTIAATQNDPLAGENGFEVRTHSATVTLLDPGTEYEYSVGNAAARSDTWTFTTAEDAGEPFTFLYFGDAQNDLGSKWRPTVEAAYERYPDAIGSVNAGDLINNSNSSEWSQWFAGMDGYSQTSNVIAAPGNHEYTGDAFMRHWKSNFEYPANGPQWSGTVGTTDAQRQEAAYRSHMAEVLTESVYFVDFQGVRFITLNAARLEARSLFTPADLPNCLIGCPNPSSLWLDMQGRWLDEILKNNPNQWAVATFHHPVLSTGAGRDEADLRAAWLPIFQRNDIDLVLMGHDHTYARGYMNVDATDRAGVTTGPVYAVAVAGPKYYDMQPEHDNVWTQNGATQVVRAGQTSTYQGITVSGGTLRYESYVAQKWAGEAASTTDVPVGGLLDSFTITKYDNGTKFVTEDGVAIPDPGAIAPVDPTDPTDPGTAPVEDPAGEPAILPLAHVSLDGLSSPTVRGPAAFDDATGILYVADASETGHGRVEAIDPATDTVLRSFETGTPITAMTFTPVEGGLLLAASQSGASGRANGYSVNPAFFGERAFSKDVVLPVTSRIVGMSIDPGTFLMYFSLAAGAVVMVDINKGSLVGQVPFGSALRGIKIDEANGNVYVALDEGNTSKLHIYAKRISGDPLRSYSLAGGAINVDLDPAAGLAYVSHGGDSGGVSAIEVLRDQVHWLPADQTGAGVQSVATHPSRERIYASTSAGVSVIARAQAPTVTRSPKPVTIDEGASAELNADATAIPSAAAQWQQRAGETWVDIDGATAPSLTVSPEESTQYRARFTNEVLGESYATVSATATVTVRAAAPVDPVDPIDPVDPVDPVDPTDPHTQVPSTRPGPVDPASFTDASRGGISASITDGIIAVKAGAERNGQWVAVYLHSTPRFLGWHQVAGGTIRVSAPAGLTGKHTLALLDTAGALVGWAPIQLDAGNAGGADTVAGGTALATTGSASPWIPVSTLALTLLALSAVLLARRRQLSPLDE